MTCSVVLYRLWSWQGFQIPGVFFSKTFPQKVCFTNELYADVVQ